MKILAIEFSCSQRSVAVSSEGIVTGRAREMAGRETRAFDLIEQALREARIEREEIDCVAVGLGPGSYAGIRIAIALAQGWQLARAVKVIGISSADCVAAQAQATGLVGRVNVMAGSCRDEYLAEYVTDQAGWKMEKPFRLRSREEMGESRRDGEVFLSMDTAVSRSANHKVLFPEAVMLATLAGGRIDFVSAEKLEPIYLRETSFVKAARPRVISLL